MALDFHRYMHPTQALNKAAPFGEEPEDEEAAGEEDAEVEVRPS